MCYAKEIVKNMINLTEILYLVDETQIEDE